MSQDARENKIEKFTGSMLKENEGFTVLFTETLQKITDATALGIYCYLSSKPSHWIINTKEICRHFNIGRDKVRKVLNYLVAIGALLPLVIRDDGKFQNKSYILKLRLSPETENQGLVTTQAGSGLSPGPEKPAPVNQGLYKIKIKNKIKKESGKEDKNPGFAAPPVFALTLFKTYKIPLPKSMTPRTTKHLSKGIDYLERNGIDLSSYLEYLSNKCSRWLLPYVINGKERVNDAYVLLSKDKIDRVLAGEFEDKTCQ